MNLEHCHKIKSNKSSVWKVYWKVEQSKLLELMDKADMIDQR
jgi:hypothetical protein